MNSFAVFIVVRFLSIYNKFEMEKKMRRTVSQMLRWPCCSDAMAHNKPLCPLWWQSLKFPQDTDTELLRRWFSWDSLCLKLAEGSMLLEKQSQVFLQHCGFIWRWDIKLRRKVCKQDLFDLEKLPRKNLGGSTEIKTLIDKTSLSLWYLVSRQTGKQDQ